jgi:hypothetical protein
VRINITMFPRSVPGFHFEKLKERRPGAVSPESLPRKVRNRPAERNAPQLRLAGGRTQEAIASWQHSLEFNPDQRVPCWCFACGGSVFLFPPEAGGMNGWYIKDVGAGVYQGTGLQLPEPVAEQIAAFAFPVAARAKPISGR